MRASARPSLLRTLHGLTRQSFAIFMALGTLTACEAPEGHTLNEVLGMDVVNGPQGSIPPGSVDPNRGAGSGCESTDPNHICLALKYVVYRDSSDEPIVSESDAQEVIQKINSLWKQCNISFTIEQFLPVKPADYSLRYQTANYSELTAIRNVFQDRNTLLVATTGTWDRTGSLGNTGANAWTSLPGSSPYGAILERPVGTNANLIAHEIGHYLNLLHVSDSSQLMNPVIYSRSTSISSSQCNTARSAAQYFWSRMIR